MKNRIHSGSPFEARYGFCRGLRINDRIEIAGTAPIPQDGSAPPVDAYAQMMLCGEIALAAIEQQGGRADDVIRTRMYITDPADADAIGHAHQALFGAARPVATMVVVAGLLDPRWRVEIEVVAEVAR
jgi:enamine deaminase RidA (YjgF/YER057c/UK114 family)